MLGRTLGGFALLSGWLTRWRTVGREKVAHLLGNDDPVIICFWHGRLVFAHTGWPLRRRRRLRMLVSQSRDGGFIAHFAASVASDPIRGSSAHKGQQRGGVEAMIAMTKHLKAGGDVGFTPDGPRGPRMRAGLGVLQLARLSGATIVPMAWSSTNAIRFKSWDRMMIILPFGKGVFAYGEPIVVPRSTSAEEMEAMRLRLEATLIALDQEADRAVGREAVEPAALAPQAQVAE